MIHYKRVAIDTSKAVFTIHCIDKDNQAKLRTDLRRAQLLAFFKKLPPTEIAMEACGGSHHWGRELTALGHSVKLIPPQYVKPFVKRGKNDRNDAEAICEAAARPNIHMVPVKTAEQQAHGMVVKLRDTLVGQRTQLVNTLRGHAGEFGIVAAKGSRAIGALLAVIAASDAVPLEAKDMLALLGEEITHLEGRIAMLTKKIEAAHKTNPVSQRLDAIPGVAAITALTMTVEVDPEAFQSGRHFAAWLGLTPKERSSGGKQRMGGISRAGNERLRELLVLGATAVIKVADRANHPRPDPWLLALLRRKPRKLAAVALANKMARIIWAMMKTGESYRQPAVAA